MTTTRESNRRGRSSLRPGPTRIYRQCTYNAERVIGNGTFGIVCPSGSLRDSNGQNPHSRGKTLDSCRYSAHIVETNETVAIKKV